MFEKKPCHTNTAQFLQHGHCTNADNTECCKWWDTLVQSWCGKELEEFSKHDFQERCASPRRLFYSLNWRQPLSLPCT